MEKESEYIRDIEALKESLNVLKSSQIGEGITSIGYAIISYANGILASKLQSLVEDEETLKANIPSFEFFKKELDMLIVGGSLTLLGHASILPSLKVEFQGTLENPPSYINQSLRTYLDLEVLSQILFVLADVLRLQGFIIVQKGAQEALANIDIKTYE